MIKNIIFDFDGVILDSMPVRDFGFREVFKKFDKNLVEKLIEFNNINGGLSRFVKIRYFYEKLLEEEITEEKVNSLANKFSSIMKKELIKNKYLINDSIDFIKENYNNYELHIASGSEHIELNYLCENIKLKNYFKTINGSPEHKNDIVERILSENTYLKSETILIGDSINDFEAAKKNGILFCGYNNKKLIKTNESYIHSFIDLDLEKI